MGYEREQIMLWALERRCKEPNTKLVLCLLASKCEYSFGAGWYFEDLSKQSRLSIPQLTDALSNLENAGHISEIGIYEDGAYFEYSLQLEMDDIGIYPEGDPRIQRSTKPRPPNRTTVGKVYARDGEQCSYCGTTDGRMVIDHIIPVSRGGTNALDNLCVSCVPCNSSKGAKLLTEWEGRKQN